MLTYEKFFLEILDLKKSTSREQCWGDQLWASVNHIN